MHGISNCPVPPHPTRTWPVIHAEVGGEVDTTYPGVLQEAVDGVDGLHSLRLLPHIHELIRQQATVEPGAGDKITGRV